MGLNTGPLPTIKHINRKLFFNGVRASLFRGSLNQSQVAGMSAILDEWDTGKWQDDLNRLSYMLATTYHETQYTMQPIVERGNRRYFDKYEPGTRIGKRLGNAFPGDGFLYRGRGDVMLTGRANYSLAGDRIGVDLVKYPERACIMGNAIKIMFHGMYEGWFTGKKLGDYFGPDKCDFFHARRIINILDCADKIASHATAFRSALFWG